MSQGMVRNPELLLAARYYAWDRVTKYTPRNIRPTDIDGAIEINGRFLFVEFKEVGKEIDKGQRLFYERLLMLHGVRGTLVIAEHEKLDVRIEPLGDVTAVTIWRWDEVVRDIAKTERAVIEGEEVFGWIIQQWCLHAEEKPNHFVTSFRRRAGIYPDTTRN